MSQGTEGWLSDEASSTVETKRDRKEKDSSTAKSEGDESWLSNNSAVSKLPPAISRVIAAIRSANERVKVFGGISSFGGLGFAY
ncbi:MAG: hypothetical protein M1816_003757 [Peltula sp. TS41687]|nr:MAG: hypothetical protein M1816_003757 [Peltula sp. TS41687]